MIPAQLTFLESIGSLSLIHIYAAIEAADVVLMTDEPSKLVDAIEVAKATKQIVMQNIVIALGIKSCLLYTSRCV